MHLVFPQIPYLARNTSHVSKTLAASLVVSQIRRIVSMRVSNMRRNCVKRLGIRDRWPDKRICGDFGNTWPPKFPWCIVGWRLTTSGQPRSLRYGILPNESKRRHIQVLRLLLPYSVEGAMDTSHHT